MKRALLFFAVLATASSCVRVRPYERELLSHPTMLLSEPAGPAELHVHAVHEGAVGGGSGAEGGCGCN